MHKTAPLSFLLAVATALQAPAQGTSQDTASLEKRTDRLTLDKLLDWENVGILRL